VLLYSYLNDVFDNSMIMPLKNEVTGCHCL